MDVEEWDVAFAWDGGLGGIDVPNVTLYEAVFRVHAPMQAVADALARLAGQPRRRLGWLGRRFVWQRPPYQFSARSRGDDVLLKAGNRLKPKPLERVIHSLADAGGEDLRIHARVRQFCAPGANVRACTPCQAAQIRRS